MSHSVQVGVCVTIDVTDVKTLTINYRLRWISDRFKNELQQVQQIANKQNITMNMVNLNNTK